MFSKSLGKIPSPTAPPQRPGAGFSKSSILSFFKQPTLKQGRKLQGVLGPICLFARVCLLTLRGHILSTFDKAIIVQTELLRQCASNPHGLESTIPSSISPYPSLSGMYGPGPTLGRRKSQRHKSQSHSSENVYIYIFGVWYISRFYIP